MKICPVCQYEEEQDSEVSCAICGSDLESSALIDEVITETEEAIETTEEPSVSDEEKLLEETLAAKLCCTRGNVNRINITFLFSNGFSYFNGTWCYRGIC